MTLPEGPRGRALALALTVVVLAIGYFALVDPSVTFYADRAQELADRRELIAKYQQAAATMPRLRAELATLKARADQDRSLLAGSSDAVAAAALQGSIKELVSASGARLVSTETLVALPHGGYRRVGIRISSTGGLTQLAQILKGIDEARPPLFVDNLLLRGNSGPPPATGGKVLSIAMEVYGFRAGP